MRIEIVQLASGARGRERHASPRPVILLIDGMEWFSSIPGCAGEAENFNLDAAALVELANRHQ